MLITIASTRIPKVNGVKKAVLALTQKFGIDSSTIRFESQEAASGVADTPASIDELMTGARQRAKTVFQPLKDERSLSIGVEGGLFRVDHSVFLQSWTCIYDGTSFYYGSSGALPIPERLAQMVFDEGIDLGVAIDRFAQQTDIRSRQGTYGVLTDDMMTREDSFELSATFALMPIFNTPVYANSR
ncbi:MAG: inosine/xanthosine triphosphatase [Bacteroidetes bacterium]|nr:inosine/xanthosine triphosphatase [Bacteroidota bacterium]